MVQEGRRMTGRPHGATSGPIDFFDAQDAALRRRRVVDACFASAVVSMSLLVLALLVLVGVPWHVATVLAVLWACVMVVPAWLESDRLDSGGKAIATALGAVPVFPPSPDAAAHRLYELVEESALAAGLPVPDVHLLPQDDSINSMVAGGSFVDAALIVTRGAAERLDRRQLEALIAHEFAHVQSGDMMVSRRVVAWAYGLSAPYEVGAALRRGLTRSFTEAVSHHRWSGLAVMSVMCAPLWLLSWAMQAAGSLGKAMATMMQAAVCRRQEPLADAAAARRCGDPAPLREVLLTAAGGPVARIGAAPSVAPSAEHLWLVSHRRGWPQVHPPLAERIAALDPEGAVGPVAEAAVRAWQAGERRRLEALVPRARAAREDAARAEAFTQSLPYLTLRATPDFVLSKVGNPDWMSLALGETLRVSLPEAISQSVASPVRSRALVLAIIAAGDDARWSRQLALIEHGLGAAVRAEVEAERVVVGALSPYLRLPAVEAAFPGLRRLARDEQRDLMTMLKALELEDGERELFELCLAASVRIGLMGDRGPTARGPARLLWHVGDALGVLVSILAHHGSPEDPTARAHAYRAGMDALAGAAAPAYSLPPNWAVALDAALFKIAALEPTAKRRVVAALTATVAHDGRLSLAEAELLRTLCAILRCPLPPLLPEVQPVGA
jgi:Zn-dependent protease with chaperone function